MKRNAKTAIVFGFLALPASSYACPASYMPRAVMPEAVSYCKQVLSNPDNQKFVELLSGKDGYAKESGFHVLNEAKAVRSWDEGCGWKSFEIKAGFITRELSDDLECIIAYKGQASTPDPRELSSFMLFGQSKFDENLHVFENKTEDGVLTRSFCPRDDNFRYDTASVPSELLGFDSSSSMVYINVSHQKCDMN